MQHRAVATTNRKEAQAMAFLAGANSIFTGEKLLTTQNPEFNEDQGLSVEEAAKRLGVSRSTAWRMVSSQPMAAPSPLLSWTPMAAPLPWDELEAPVLESA